jgi:uncharacterized protein
VVDLASPGFVLLKHGLIWIFYPSKFLEGILHARFVNLRPYPILPIDQSVKPQHIAFIMKGTGWWQRAFRVPQKVLLLIIVAICSVVSDSVMTAEYVRSLKEIREEGVIIQKWDTSCGAAAMATVFTYHFNDPSTEREVAQGLLRQTEPMKVRHRGGFSMLDMKNYARERGYKAIGFKGLSFEELRYFDGPIVPVNFHGYNHYVVYKGLTAKDRVSLADPAYGNRTLSRERFERFWIQGMAFTLLRKEP